MSNFPEHDELGELAGLYVLGGLAPAERRAFEEHLAACEVCAEEVRALGAVAQALPYAVTQIDPPASLRTRVLAVTGESASARGHVVPMPTRQTARPSRSAR